MSDIGTIQSSYNGVAAEYGVQLFHELTGKPLDRKLLSQFARELMGQGEICDLCCGPGQIGRFLADCGAKCSGIDLSDGMIAEAARRNPDIRFETGNLLDLPESSYAGIACFYGIVHLKPEQLVNAFRSISRALTPGGKLLIAFHLGEGGKHVEEMWGVSVVLDFVFFSKQTVLKAMMEAGLVVDLVVERAPYEGAEFPTRRAYIRATAGDRP